MKLNLDAQLWNTEFINFSFVKPNKKRNPIQHNLIQHIMKHLLCQRIMIGYGFR